MKSSVATVVAEILWRIPGRFRVARLLGSSYSLRCLVFHDVSPRRSPFTSGINVTTTPEEFEATLGFIKKYYSPVSLQEVLTNSNDGKLPSDALLLTFDDAYASVSEFAAPLCKQLGIPAVFFVNAAFVDNRRLAPDNLICYVTDLYGMERINAAARSVFAEKAKTWQSLSEVFGVFLPSLSMAERESFLKALREQAGIEEENLASESKLYITSDQLRSLSLQGIEIGNHTYTHTHCRKLTGKDLASEINGNKSELEAMSGERVRAFSVPYGAAKDMTPELAKVLRESGHQAVFLSESVANPRKPDLFRLDRISSHAEGNDALFVEIELMPRLRAIRNRYFHNVARA
jgi:peptidoglycan/xylan/chitin deacetylase (PgdA/CDA1 family)